MGCGKSTVGALLAERLRCRFLDLDALIEDCGPTLWIHGHVHDSFEYTIGRTTVTCNPRGYLGYGENPRFDAGRCFKLRAPAV